MDGIIVINKEKKMTSHDVVYKVKKIFNTKVGHTGTLDPNATGVLPILIGKGTLLSKYLINHDKTYEVVLKLGIKTDTADEEGNVLKNEEVPNESLKKEYINKILKGFIGKQEQLPPMYSAIKVNGKKLYEYARKGIEIERNPRIIEIYEINLQEVNDKEKQICFIVKCSKGTYIRSLCEDIANKLNTVGYMKELKRTQVGDFTINNAVTIKELENNFSKKDFIDKYFISIENLFGNLNSIELDDKELKKFLNGVLINKNNEDGVYRIYKTNEFIGLGVIREKRLKRDIVIEK